MESTGNESMNVQNYDDIVTKIIDTLGDQMSSTEINNISNLPVNIMKKFIDEEYLTRFLDNNLDELVENPVKTIQKVVKKFNKENAVTFMDEALSSAINTTAKRLNAKGHETLYVTSIFDEEKKIAANFFH